MKITQTSSRPKIKKKNGSAIMANSTAASPRRSSQKASNFRCQRVANTPGIGNWRITRSIGLQSPMVAIADRDFLDLDTID